MNEVTAILEQLIADKNAQLKKINKAFKDKDLDAEEKSEFEIYILSEFKASKTVLLDGLKTRRGEVQLDLIQDSPGVGFTSSNTVAKSCSSKPNGAPTLMALSSAPEDSTNKDSANATFKDEASTSSHERSRKRSTSRDCEGHDDPPNESALNTSPGDSSKRRRFPTDRFNPFRPRNIKESAEYIISDQQRRESSLTAEAASRLPKLWKQVEGIKEHFGKTVYVNPWGCGYGHKIKDFPILGLDFFLDPRDALAYIEEQAGKLVEPVPAAASTASALAPPPQQVVTSSASSAPQGRMRDDFDTDCDDDDSVGEVQAQEQKQEQKQGEKEGEKEEEDLGVAIAPHESAAARAAYVSSLWASAGSPAPTSTVAAAAAAAAGPSTAPNVHPTAPQRVAGENPNPNPNQNENENECGYGQGCEEQKDSAQSASPRPTGRVLTGNHKMTGRVVSVSMFLQEPPYAPVAPVTNIDGVVQRSSALLATLNGPLHGHGAQSTAAASLSSPGTASLAPRPRSDGLALVPQLQPPQVALKQEPVDVDEYGWGQGTQV